MSTPYQPPVHGPHTLPAAADILKPGLRVTVNSSGQAALADNSVKGLGVIAQPVKSGHLATVEPLTPGRIVRFVASAAVATIGGNLRAAAGGKVTQSGSDPIVAIALGTCAADGDFVDGWVTTD